MADGHDQLFGGENGRMNERTEILLSGSGGTHCARQVLLIVGSGGENSLVGKQRVRRLPWTHGQHLSTRAHGRTALL